MAKTSTKKSRKLPNPKIIQAVQNFILGAGKITQEQANEYLQADLYALVEQTFSRPVKPAQALGIANALLLTGVLAVFYRFRWREGQVFALLLILYPLTRFVLESIRDQNAHDLTRGVLTHNQITSIVMAAAGLLILLGLRRLPPSAGPAWAERLGNARTVRTGGRKKKQVCS